MTAREIVLEGGSPWGFRMNGGADVGHALRISRVNPGSKASQKGVREGDVITSINGQQTKCLTNGDSHALLRSVGNTLRLGLNEDTNGSPKRRSKEAQKRDTSSSSSQNVPVTSSTAPTATVATTTATAPAATVANGNNAAQGTEEDAAADTATVNGSSNAKGNKSKHKRQQQSAAAKTVAEQQRQGQDTSSSGVSTQNHDAAAGEDNQNGTGKISASKARRMRKARQNNQKKANEELNKNGQQEKVSLCASCCGGEKDDTDKSVEVKTNEEVEEEVTRQIEACSKHNEGNGSELSKNKAECASKDTQPNNGNKISSSKARRMRKARINNQRKEEEKDEREKMASLNNEESGCSTTVVTETKQVVHEVFTKTEKITQIMPTGQTIVDITVVGKEGKEKLENRSNLSESSTKLIIKQETASEGLSENTREKCLVHLSDSIPEGIQSIVSTDTTTENGGADSNIVEDTCLRVVATSSAVDVPSKDQPQRGPASGEVHNSDDSYRVSVEKSELNDSNTIDSGEISYHQADKNDVDADVKEYDERIGAVDEQTVAKDSMERVETKKSVHFNLEQNSSRQIEEESTENVTRECAGNVANTAKVVIVKEIELPKLIEINQAPDVSQSDGRTSPNSLIVTDEFERKDCKERIYTEHTRRKSPDIPLTCKLSTVSQSQTATEVTITESFSSNKSDTEESNEISEDANRKSPIPVFVHPPKNEAVVTNVSWECVSDFESSSSQTQQSSDEEDIRMETLIYLPPNDFGSCNYNILSGKPQSEAVGKTEEDGLTVDDVSKPLIEPEEEQKLRCFLNTLDLTKPEEMDDTSSATTTQDESSMTSGSESSPVPPPAKEEVVVYRHTRTRCVPETCFIPPDSQQRRWLEVITEELSDIGDFDRRSDVSDINSEKPWENSYHIRKNNEMESIPNDWYGSDNEVETSDSDGIDTSWTNGKRLEDAEGVEVVYLNSDSNDDEILYKTFRDDVNPCEQNAEESKPPEASEERRENFLLKREEVNEIKVNAENTTGTNITEKSETTSKEDDPTVANEDNKVENEEPVNVIFRRRGDDDINARINKVKEIVEILNSTFEINKDSFEDCAKKSKNFDDKLKQKDACCVESNIEEKSSGNSAKDNIDTQNQNNRAYKPRANLNNSIGVRAYHEMINNIRNGQSCHSNDDTSKDNGSGDTNRLSTKEIVENNLVNSTDPHFVAEDNSANILLSFNSEKYIKQRELQLLEESRRDYSSDDSLPAMPQEKTDVVSPETYSRQGSSSSGSASHSTAKFYPGNSPMSSETDGESTVYSADQRVRRRRAPKSLQKLAENVVLSLPNGGFFLERIGYYDDCDRTPNKSRKSNVKNTSRSSIIEDNNIVLYRCSTSSVKSYSPPESIVLVSSPTSASTPPPVITAEDNNHWVGMPTSVDPHVLICLSPAQSKNHVLPSSKEATGLLDLHKKFMERRGYHEQNPATRRGVSPKSEKSITPDGVSSPVGTLHLNIYENGKLETVKTTKEILQEAAALLALNEYRHSRFNKVNNNSNNTNENNLKNNLNISNTSNKTIDKREEKSSDLMTSRDTKITDKEDFKDNDINRSAGGGGGGGSRLLAIIQSNNSMPAVEPRPRVEHNNRVLSEMDRTGSTVGLQRFHPSNSFISQWIKLSKNVGDDATSDKENINCTNTFIEKEREQNNNNNKEIGSFEKVVDKTVTENEEETRQFETVKYRISKQGDIAVNNSEFVESAKSFKETARPKSLPPTGAEIFRQKMYEEYMDKVQERTERRQQKVIKISPRPASVCSSGGEQESGNSGGQGYTSVEKLETEFMDKVRERMNKLGINLDESDTETQKQQNDKKKSDNSENSSNNNTVVIDNNNSSTDASSLPKHLQEFLQLTTTTTTAAPFGGDDGQLPADAANTGVWSPSQTPEAQRKEFVFTAVASKGEKQDERKKSETDSEPQPVVWTPRSAGSSPTAERKSFKPINFESPKLSRKTYTPQKSEDSPKPPTDLPITVEWAKDNTSSSAVSSSLSRTSGQQVLTSTRLVTSHSAPDTSDIRLPRAQNPTITLLQKAREGQLPRGAHYLDENTTNDEKFSSVYPNEVLYSVKKEYESETEDKRPKKIVELGPKKIEGIGPTTKEGIPIVLRSEVKDINQQKWYKRMYDSLHKADKGNEFVTVRYKTKRRGQYPYTSAGGYLSEPEPLGGGYDSDITSSKYATLDRRRIRNKENDFSTNTMPRNKFSQSAAVKHAVDIYKNQPGRIEDYEPGHSSIAEKEAKQHTVEMRPARSWWDEVMDIFDGEFEQPKSSVRPTSASTTSGKPFMTYALKESGYESDSTLVFKRRDENLQQQLSPAEQKMAYKSIQKGGEVPLHGLRKPAPERPKVQDDSELEYFPISPHLTRIRIHKTKQNIKPVKEIICYPITTIETDAPLPPIFASYKRTAKASTSLMQSSLSASKPPCPPKRQSSKHNSTLRLYSKMSVDPYSFKSCAPSSSAGIEVDSNVQYLKDRIASKLGVAEPVSTCTSRKGKSTSPSTKPQKYVSRGGSVSPGARTTIVTSPCGTSKVMTKKALLEKKTYGSLRSRRDQITSRLSQSSDLRAPAEVKKVLKEREAKERTKLNLGSSGTIVKSSTTLYSSHKKKPKEDKSLKVTVAISSKGKELLRTSSSSNVGEGAKKSETPFRPSSSSPRLTKTNIKLSRTDLQSATSDKPLHSRHSSSRETVTSVQSTRQLKSSTSRTSLTSSITIDQSKKIKKVETNGVTNEKVDHAKRKKDKNGVTHTKPVSTVKSESTRKVLSNSDVTEINGKKKSKRSKDSDSPGSSKKGSKKNGVKKSRDKDSKRESKKEPKTKLVNGDMASEREPTPEFGDFDIKQSGPLHSDTFFQHLLLRNIPSPTPSTVSSLYHSASVLEKAKKFHQTDSQPDIPYKSEPSLRMMNVYLNHKKPVTESKFRSLDRETASVRSSRSQSPYFARSRPYDFFEKIDHFDRMNNVWERSTCSPSVSRTRSPEVIKERSSSEPPRSTSAQPDTFGNIDHAHWDYENISPYVSRSPSCRRIKSAKTSTKTIESIGGIKKKGVRARSAGESESRKAVSPVQAHSTSSLSLSHLTDHSDYQTYVMELLHSSKKSARFRELHKFYTSLERMGQLERTTSSTDLRPRMKGEEVIDFDRWKQLRTKEKAEEELKTLYEKLKEDQKEKGLLFRPRDTEALKWRGDRGLRCKEKSVEDLKQHFHKLSVEESEIELSKRRELEAKKDVYKPLWRGSSVLNLASALASVTTSRKTRPVSDYTVSLPRSSDKSKQGRSIGSRLWSSLSMEQVNALKHQLSEIYSTVSSLKRDRISKMLHSNLSRKEYEISVPPAKDKLSESSDALHVRCNSLLTNDQLYSPHIRRKEAKRSECMKADSIGSIPQWKERKDSSSGDSTRSSVVKPLSESEKKRLSLTLSQEILDRVSKRRKDEKKKKKRPSASIVIPRETLGAVAAIKGNKKFPRPKSPTASETQSPRTCYSIEMSEEGSAERHTSSASPVNGSKNDFLLVLAPKENDTQEVKKMVDEWAENKTHQKPIDDRVVARLVRTTSASETESGSSDASTVIHLGSREDVQKKINLLSTQKSERSSENLLERVSRSDTDVRPFKEEIKERTSSAPDYITESKVKQKLFSSQSFADFKELFGERKAMMYVTVPPKRPAPSKLTIQEISSSKETVRKDSATHSSEESIVRSRSVTPDPMKYYRAYLHMVKAGDVRRLRNKFESLEDIPHLVTREPSPQQKRYQSDPDLTRDFLARHGTEVTKTIVRGQESGDVQWLRRRYESETHRSRSKTRKVVSPVPLKPDNRFMPHINIISKLAALQQRRSLTAPPRPESCIYRTGEVDRLRQHFETQQQELSLLGQMYTSTPDVRELRDIAPYLECEWIAHQYPKPRSLSSPETQRSTVCSPRPRPMSSSPVRRPQTSSILKQQQKKQRDIFANQQFDPTIHRPLYRYQPPPVMDTSLHYRPWRTDPNWWWRHMYYATKPTVTFKEPTVPGRRIHIPPPQRDTYGKDLRRPESPHRYVESEVTIHYRSPVRSEEKEAWSEEELARRQAEAMRRIYQEERRRKYLQELQDMYSRRHTDNFIPSQKSPIPLNRYDDFLDDLSPGKPRDRTPEPKLVARALYNFIGQTSRELTFRRGDIIYVRRQIDKNWYEGEHNAMVGLFPINYVEIIPYDGIRTVPKRPSEGQARAKFNFQAQTHLELPLVKGELVLLTRRVDDNWFEGRIGNRKGIFPVSYVDVLVEPGERTLSPVRMSPSSNKPVASPASHSLHVSNNMSQHHYQPPRPVSYTSLPRQKVTKSDVPPPVNQTLHIDTQNEPVPYRVLYNYKPQNEDELELTEGETVYVMEKCDDGWYVGSSQRTGYLGTFPGNYVERIA